jgi:hypothetical protein
MSRRHLLTLAVALAATAAAVAYGVWAPPALAGTALSCATASAGDDELAFALCERSAQMQAVCDTVPADVRDHCHRCFIFGNPLACDAGTAADNARCRAVEHAVVACVGAAHDAVDTCQSLAWRAVETPAPNALSRFLNR